jgi:hypothetical protein
MAEEERRKNKLIKIETDFISHPRWRELASGNGKRRRD